MYQLDNFWEIKFADFLPIIATILSPILIYLVYVFLNKWQEKKQIKTALIRFKSYLETKLHIDEEKAPEGTMSFFRNLQKTKPEILIKIGIEVMEIDAKISALFIVDKFMMVTGGKFENWVIHKDIAHNKTEFGNILLEIIKYAKKYYGIKLCENLAKF